MKKLLALFIAVVTLVSFTACEKKEIIGYEPEIPPEWAEEEEKMKNDPTTEINRMNDFNGIWQNVADGKYYHIFGGRIYLLDKLDAGAGDYIEWGTIVAPQRVEKEFAENYNPAGGNNIRPDDVITVDIRTSYSSVYQVTATLIDENRIKTVDTDGKEYIFKLIEIVYNYPEGIGYY